VETPESPFPSTTPAPVTAEPFEGRLTTPAAPSSSITRAELVRLSRADPDRFFTANIERNVPLEPLAEVTADCYSMLNTTAPLFSALVNHAVRTECEASLLSWPRGSTPMYQLLCMTLFQIYQNNCARVSCPDAIFRTFDFSMAHASQPGHTCLLLQALCAIQPQIGLSLSLESLVARLHRHLPLLGAFNQQAKLSFVPWLDAERLLLVFTSCSPLEANKTMASLKAAYRLQLSTPSS
jgi:hypothetical protein